MSKLPMITLLLVLLLAAATTLTEAQNVPSCASELVGCADYINSNATPSASCCDPLKKAVENELQCLCTLYSDPAFKAFNISVDKAMRLSKDCGISSDLSACANAGSPTGSVSPPPPPAQAGAEKITWTGISSILLVFASALLY